MIQRKATDDRRSRSIDPNDHDNTNNTSAAALLSSFVTVHHSLSTNGPPPASHETGLAPVDFFFLRREARSTEATSSRGDAPSVARSIV